jgi:hypothetical protein
MNYMQEHIFNFICLFKSKFHDLLQNINVCHILFPLKIAHCFTRDSIILALDMFIVDKG